MKITEVLEKCPISYFGYDVYQGVSCKDIILCMEPTLKLFSLEQPPQEIELTLSGRPTVGSRAIYVSYEDDGTIKITTNENDYYLFTVTQNTLNRWLKEFMADVATYVKKRCYLSYKKVYP